MDFLSEYIDVGGIEKVSINIRCGPVEEMPTADGEDLAHRVGSMQNAILVRICCPHEIMLLDMLDNDNIIGNAFQQFRKLLIEATFLPNAPQHPLMPESQKIGPDVFLVFSL